MVSFPDPKQPRPSEPKPAAPAGSLPLCVADEPDGLEEVVPEDSIFRLRLTEPQMRAWNATEPYVGLCFGIRGGKTYFGRNWILRRVVEFPESEHIATANSYDQLRLVTIPNIERGLKEWGLPYVHAKGERAFKIRIERRTVLLHYRSMENFDLVRGAEFGSAWMDELRDTKKDALEMMKGRLSCPKIDVGRLLCTTTPNGYDAFYDEFFRYAKPGKHFAVRSRTRDNPFLPDWYVEQIYDAYDPDRAAQELDADFRVMGAGKVYSSFLRERNGKGLAYNPQLPLWICIDFNIGAPMAWVLAQTTGNGEIHAVAELYLRDCTIPRMAKVLAEGGRLERGRVSPAWAKIHKQPWHITGDASDARNRESGKSDWKVLLEHLAANGIHPTLHKPNSNPRVKDRVNSVNAALLSALGRTRCYVNESCPELITDLEQNTWRNGDIDDRDKTRGHAAAAFGYLVHQKFPATGPTLHEGQHMLQ